MLTIKLNDLSITLEKNISLMELLTIHHPTQHHFAVALNQQFIPRQQHPHTLLQEGDVIDVILPMQGG